MKKNYLVPHTTIVSLETSSVLQGEWNEFGSDDEPAANQSTLDVEDGGYEQGKSLWDE